jgi:type I restriction enzyme S subunit
LEDIEPQTMKILNRDRNREVRSSSLRFSKGDILYGKMRPYLKKGLGCRI